MSSFGRQVVGQVGTSNRLSVDGSPEHKFAGVTIDWSSVVAVSGADVSLDDGVTIAIGEKYLPRGQVICRITTGQIVTVTITGSPTGGTFTVTVGGQTTSGVAYNASAATLQAAIRALSTVGGTLASVSGSAGGPYTVTFDYTLGEQVVTASAAGLTGGTPVITVAETSAGARTDKYGPYDTAAVDGRQTLTPGECFCLDELVREGDIKSDHPVAIYGGKVWKARLKATSGTHSLANGPTYTELLAVMPRLQFVS